MLEANVHLMSQVLPAAVHTAVISFTTIPPNPLGNITFASTCCARQTSTKDRQADNEQSKQNDEDDDDLADFFEPENGFTTETV